MRRAFEVIWKQGKVIPTEVININEHTRLLVVILDEQIEEDKASGGRSLKGKYKGKFSSVDEFIHHKQEEKRLER